VARIIATRNLSGVLGTVILLLFSTQFFAAARLVMGDIFGEPKGRGIVRGLLYDVLLIMVVGALFLANVVVTLVALWFKSWFLDPADVPLQWARSMFLGLALVFDTALFFMAYRYFPARRVPAGVALAGALLASVLWEIAKHLFRWYILSVGVYDAIYGTLGVLMALIMFTYYTGIVFILGAEFAAALERRGAR
jgi:membrane protein